MICQTKLWSLPQPITENGIFKKKIVVICISVTRRHTCTHCTCLYSYVKNILYLEEEPEAFRLSQQCFCLYIHLVLTVKDSSSSVPNASKQPARRIVCLHSLTTTIRLLHVHHQAMLLSQLRLLSVYSLKHNI